MEGAGLSTNIICGSRESQFTEINWKQKDENKYIILFISKAIAKANRALFKDKLLNEFYKSATKEFKYLIFCDKEHELPIIDQFGRITYFKFRIGGMSIPLYQPGTIMFETGMKDGDFKVFHNNAQQNGPILGNGCALFLARVLAKLNKKYNKYC